MFLNLRFLTGIFRMFRILLKMGVIFEEFCIGLIILFDETIGVKF
jgi:hypothetical protein